LMDRGGSGSSWLGQQQTCQYPPVIPTSQFTAAVTPSYPILTG
jgi:hypothetical protein